MKTLDVSDRDWGRRAFSPASCVVVRALVEALFSDEDPDHGLAPARPELAERVVDEFDLFVGAGSTYLRRGFVLLVFAIEWLPFFAIGAFSRASRLPLARRMAYLQALEHSKIGLLTMLFVGLKLPLTMLAFETGQELRMTGFDRPSLGSRRALHVLRSGGLP